MGVFFEDSSVNQLMSCSKSQFLFSASNQRHIWRVQHKVKNFILTSTVPYAWLRLLKILVLLFARSGRKRNNATSARCVGTRHTMNWHSKSTSEVNKEKIWSELVKKEHRELRVFDTYRSSSAGGKANTAPVSERHKRFLHKNQLLFESSVQLALPELRQASLSSQGLEGGRYSLPLHNMQHRCAALSPTRTSTGGALSGTLSDLQTQSGDLSRKISSNSLSSVASRGSSVGGVSSTSCTTPVSSKPPLASTSPFFRPTSASEIGSMLSPLVNHRVGSYRYTIPSTDIRLSLRQK